MPLLCDYGDQFISPILTNLSICRQESGIQHVRSRNQCDEIAGPTWPLLAQLGKCSGFPTTRRHLAGDDLQTQMVLSREITGIYTSRFNL